MMKEEVEIEYVPINKVHVSKKNPRRITEEGLKRGIKSLRENPRLFLVRPLLCTPRNYGLEILAGNLRYLAAKQLKYSEVPVIIMRGLTPTEEKLITILDNVSFGKWDFSALVTSEWSALPLGEWGVKIPKRWLTGPKEVFEDGFDGEAEAKVIVETVTKPGDIWTLGDRHRVMCGDWTNREDVAELLGSERADLVMADPVYGSHIVGKVESAAGNGEKGGGSKGHSPVVGDEVRETARRVYQLSQDIGIEKVILWGGNYFTDFLPPSRCWIIWDKQVDTTSSGSTECEMAWTSLTFPARIFRETWNGYARKRKGDAKDSKRVQPMQKPVSLLAFCIKNYSGGEDVILDVFAGTGNSLIAAEQLGRTCYGMERDPVSCDLIVKRWEKFTERKGLSKKTGGK